MKIDDMINKEDFYEILLLTLNSYYDDLIFSTEKESVQTKFLNELYVYEKINAIIHSKPSKEILSFLKKEYDIRGSILKKVLVNIYLKFKLHSNGYFAEKKVFYFSLNNHTDFKNILIYPCNKKIRIFNFSNRIVNVVTKYGYPNSAIEKEINFRLDNLNDHIIPIESYGENWYSERIIDGKPLARIKNLEEYNKFKVAAHNILLSISKKHNKKNDIESYFIKLENQININIDKIKFFNENISKNVIKLLEIIRRNIDLKDFQIILTLSHGDLHAGNIWIENSTNKILIIDWETVEVRSEWYDLFVLHGGFRETNGIEKMINSIRRNNISYFLQSFSLNAIERIMYIVLMEEIAFRLNDILSSPPDINLKEFEVYFKRLLSSLLANNIK
jgi:thiamine kinase-like enzyme